MRRRRSGRSIAKASVATDWHDRCTVSLHGETRDQTNYHDAMTDPRFDPTRVESKPAGVSMTDTAMNELAELARDTRSLANAIRDGISLASQESQEAWVELDRQLETFLEAIEESPEQSLSKLREMGFALRRSLRALRDRIEPGPERP